jgi:hypothetical protein
VLLPLLTGEIRRVAPAQPGITLPRMLGRVPTAARCCAMLCYPILCYVMLCYAFKHQCASTALYDAIEAL